MAEDVSHYFAHVRDSTHFEVPRAVAPQGRLEIPQPFSDWGVSIQLPKPFEPLDLRLTKFMVLETIVAIVMAVIFIWVAQRVASSRTPRGRLWNLFEAFLVFIRDGIARPTIGKHDADRFLPFLWTMFFFVLFCNLIGMLPWSGTPTGAMATTSALALITFGAVVGSGMRKMGAVGFWKAQVPHMDLPKPIAVVIIPLIFVIEVIGLLIRHFVLAVRLLANMFAGHLVLAVIMGFIASTAVFPILWWGIMPASVFGAVALNMLELLVAFIQAYIFTFLSALFIGMAVHPH
jgi:F-type H+-transporting ATPase subunit a